MHFSKAIAIFAGSAAAVPLGISTSSSSSGLGVGTSGTGVSASVPGVGTVCLDLFGGCGSSSGTTKSTTGSTGSTVGSTTGSTGSTVGSTTGSTGTTGTTGGTGTSGSTGSTASKAAVASIVPSTGSTGSTVGSTTGSTGSTVGSTTGSTGSTVGSTIGSTGGTVGSTIGSTGTSGSSLSVTQGQSIYDDLVALDGTVNAAITTLLAFTSDNTTPVKKAALDTQAAAVGKAGEAWQTATVKLLTDTQALAGKGQFSSADSTRIASYINSHVADDLQKLYQAIIDKKAQFGYESMTKNVHDGLSGIRDEIKMICDVLVPLLLSADYPYMQTAGTTIYAAAQKAIDAFA